MINEKDRNLMRLKVH